MKAQLEQQIHESDPLYISSTVRKLKLSAQNRVFITAIRGQCKLSSVACPRIVEYPVSLLRAALYLRKPHRIHCEDSENKTCESAAGGTCDTLVTM